MIPTDAELDGDNHDGYEGNLNDRLRNDISKGRAGLFSYSLVLLWRDPTSLPSASMLLDT